VAISGANGWASAPPELDRAVVYAPEDLVERLPVEVNERVEYWMRHYQGDQRAIFQRFLEREGLYSKLIRDRLRERGMPQELLYLAMVESGFSARARSRVAAVGMWQFMSPTAKEYGLRVDAWVDERRDPVRATEAALVYLQWLHDRYGSWYLAAAAYNAGPSRVDRALRRSGLRRGEEAIYWDVVHHLPRETREYVPKILAATILSARAEELGFQFEPDSPYEYDRVWVPGGTSLRVLAESLGLAPERLRDLNPHLIQGVTPPDGLTHELRVPRGKASHVVASMNRRRWSRFADD
jgi:membrane-bound lytic murein transglycosylase D